MDEDDEHERAIEGWWVIEESRRIGRAPRTVMRHGERIVLWRDATGTLHAHDARCPHRGVDLGEGRVVRGELECAYHGFRFDGAGRCTAMPCEGADRRPPDGMRLTRHEVREARGLVWLWRGERRDPLPALPWPDAMPPDDAGSCTRTMLWRVPLSRVMEAMLDVHHFPFAHRRFAYGVGARLDPFSIRSEEGALHGEGWLRHDGASQRSGWRFGVEARLPGQVYLSFLPTFGGLVACTPIDGESTYIVARFFVRVPVIGALLAWLAISSELAMIQPDDERMQRKTLRAQNDLSECTLVRADAALVEWDRLVRKQRAKTRASRHDAASRASSRARAHAGDHRAR